MGLYPTKPVHIPHTFVAKFQSQSLKKDRRVDTWCVVELYSSLNPGNAGQICYAGSRSSGLSTMFFVKNFDPGVSLINHVIEKQILRNLVMSGLAIIYNDAFDCRKIVHLLRA